MEPETHSHGHAKRMNISYEYLWFLLRKMLTSHHFRVEGRKQVTSLRNIILLLFVYHLFVSFFFKSSCVLHVIGLPLPQFAYFIIEQDSLGLKGLAEFLYKLKCA